METSEVSPMNSPFRNPHLGASHLLAKLVDKIVELVLT
jgi:hypothetical protein